MSFVDAIADSFASAAHEAADATITAILDAALEEFQLIGIRRATVSSIAARADVAPVTIYRRLGQKDALIAAALARETTRTLAQLAEAVEPFKELEERIVETFIAVRRFVFAHPLVVRLAQLEPDALASQLTTDAGPLLALCEHFIYEEVERANARGDSTVDDPSALASVLARLFHSLFLTPPEEIVADEQRARAYARRIVVPLVS